MISAIVRIPAQPRTAVGDPTSHAGFEPPAWVGDDNPSPCRRAWGQAEVVEPPGTSKVTENDWRASGSPNPGFLRLWVCATICRHWRDDRLLRCGHCRFPDWSSARSGLAGSARLGDGTIHRRPRSHLPWQCRRRRRKAGTGMQNPDITTHRPRPTAGAAGVSSMIMFILRPVPPVCGTCQTRYARAARQHPGGRVVSTYNVVNFLVADLQVVQRSCRPSWPRAAPYRWC